VIFRKAYIAAESVLFVGLKRQEGQALVEYALILALLTVVSMFVLQALGFNISRVFLTVQTQLSAVP
jgi:Flp pilus assembly pilin Flp